MLEKLPSAITAVSFLALSVSIAHEWAYFGVIGTEFQELYTTPDYITLLIESVGGAFLFVIVLGLIHLIALRADNFTLRPPSQANTFAGFMDRKFVWIFAGFFALLDFFFSRSQVNFSAYVLFIALVFRGLIYVLQHETLREYDKGWTAVLIYGLPIATIFAYAAGKSSAYDDLANDHPDYRVTIKNQLVSRDVNVLRLLDKGAIVFDPNTRAVEFLKQDIIAGLARTEPKLDSRSFACKHWNVSCGSSK